jgi:phage-related protein
MKELTFVGSSIDDLRAFPSVARQRCGFQLHLVQSGRDPFDWKPMPSVGPGCREIRVRDSEGIYRVFYVTTVGKRVFVLHCFEKKSQQTTKTDIEIGKQRYKLIKEHPIQKEKK